MYPKRNIVVSGTGDGVLVDFGYSRIKHEFGQTNTPHQVGRYGYNAPEISYDEGAPRINEKSDVYSFGMTLYGLGTLSPPYEGLNAHQARQAAAEGKRHPDTTRSVALQWNTPSSYGSYWKRCGTPTLAEDPRSLLPAMR